MDEEIREVKSGIRKASKSTEDLFAAKKKADKANFDSDQEKELQYWIMKEEYLIKKEEALRKKEILLLEISKNESESKLFYSLQ